MPLISERNRYRWLRRATKVLLPQYRLTHPRKLWFQDKTFWEPYEARSFGPMSADRKFFVRELLKLVAHLPGDTAEAGVFTGATSWFICEARKGMGTHWGFDSFDGLAEPSAEDEGNWQAHDLTAEEANVRRLLAPYEAKIFKGWIPDVFAAADGLNELVFAHIDVDLYEATLASLECFYPKLVAGGVLICDDYGYTDCPGAKRAVDEYMAGREPVLHAPTGQAIILRSR